MKKVTWRITTLLGAGVASLLSLFSNTSCHFTEVGRMEYGTPHADFELKVKVQSPSADPIEGLEIESVHKVEREGEVSYQSTKILGKTDNFGALFVRNDIFPSDQMYYVRITDKDGDRNGAWETKIDSVKISRSDIRPDGKYSQSHWHSGTASKTMVVTMSPLDPKDTDEK